MKNLKTINELAKECMVELDKLNIKYGKVAYFEINSRAKKRWGQCRKLVESNTYVIQVSNRLLDESVPVQSLKQTIMHELLHTCTGCMNHGKTWKDYADRVNKAYGYDVSRTTSAKSLGVDTENIRNDIKHQFVCKNCGQVINRTRESNFTKNYQHYKCGICNGKFKKVF